jgi:signal transduction histidine kinase
MLGRSQSTKEIEQELKLSRESLEFALESGRMGTWEVDLKTDKIICSKEMLNLWGIDPATFSGDRSLLQNKVHTEDVEAMIALIEQAITTKRLYEVEYRICPSPNEVKWVHSRGRMTYQDGSDQPARFAGIVYDITERKNKDEALNNAIRARDQFFMIASHELKTPLTCLQLQLQVSQWKLKHKYPEAFGAEKLEIEYKKQKEQVLRITRIVDNILDVSRISEGRLMLNYEDFNLNEMISEILDFFKLAAESNGIEVKFDSSKLIQGRWDRFRLEQVLLNLLINAVRYGNRKPIQVEVVEHGDRVHMIVRDEGMGIREDLQHRVFKRFEGIISENDSSGVGLGLYISNSIAIAHGGEIKLKSELGKGSEFSVILPRFHV